MIRPAARLLAVLATLAAAAAGAVAAPYVAEAAPVAVPAAAADPLAVSIDEVTPSSLTLDPDVPVTMSGTITNSSTSTWSDLVVYPLTSRSPASTDIQLASLLALPATSAIGDRLTAQRAQPPGSLAPGQSTTFDITIPRDALRISEQAGVYWLAVQVTGSRDARRQTSTAGRARVLLPLLGSGKSTSVALVVPFREYVARDEKGRIADRGAWDRLLGADGRLGRLLGLAASADSAVNTPVSWLVDPAVLDAASSLADGNEAYSLTPAKGNVDATATSWLAQFTAEAQRRDLLSLPYGDIDVASAYRASATDLLSQARAGSAAVLQASGLQATPVTAPASGRLPWTALTPATGDTLLGVAAVRDGATRVDVAGGPRLTLATTLADQAALPARQQILATAAVHALSPDAAQPLVVELPGDWDPGASWRAADFFAGLDVPWLQQTSAATVVTQAPATQTLESGSSRLREPVAADTADVPDTTFAEAARLVRTGRLLSGLVTGDDDAESTASRWALLALSAAARGDAAAGTHMAGQESYLRSMTAKVTVRAPSFVTMSSEQGPFQVTVDNALPVSVTVSVVGVPANGRHLSVDSAEATEIPAGQRRSFRLIAHAGGLGEYRLQVQVVTADGEQIGNAADLRIRSSRVGRVIWSVLAAGTALLIGLIVARIRRRVRARQKTHGPVLVGAREDADG